LTWDLLRNGKLDLFPPTALTHYASHNAIGGLQGVAEAFGVFRVDAVVVFLSVGHIPVSDGGLVRRDVPEFGPQRLSRLLPPDDIVGDSGAAVVFGRVPFNLD